MWLLIDDIRDLNCDVIARTAKAGLKLLEQGGWSTVCFDHDLGEDEATGYEVMAHAFLADWMKEVKHVQLVTSNPVGRTNMANLLKDEGYSSKDGINFYHE
jgi:hypothetical protein